VGQSSSHPQGSRYTDLLAHLGRPSDVVETDYLSTVALFTGHRTAYGAFTQNLNGSCSLAKTLTALRDDHAAYLLLADLNKPNMIDNTCLLSEASSQPWAVQLLHTSRDQGDVYELIGPGTAHPDLQEVSLSARVTGSDPLVSVPPSVSRPNAATSGTAATIAQNGRGWLEWDWSGPRTVTQVSLDSASAASATTGVSLQLDEPGRGWVTVTSSPTAVGDGRGDAPYLLAALPVTTARGVRVVIEGTGVVHVNSMHVIGPATAGGKP
ncbi:MAG: hypothetical protein J2P57_13530, partial [Acidimicrobiaceae bacterium]|nr:hypothetical protein [Acidimicrobiaceae bacterium]